MAYRTGGLRQIPPSGRGVAFVSGGGSHVLCSHGIRVLPELYGISAVPSVVSASSGKEKELALQRQEELRRQFGGSGADFVFIAWGGVFG